MAEDTIEDIEMASSFKEEMLSEPVLFSDQEMSLDSRQFSDQEMLSDPLAEDASMDNFSKADGAEEPQFTSLKTYGERGPSTVKMMVIDAEAEVCIRQDRLWTVLISVTVRPHLQALRLPRDLFL